MKTDTLFETLREFVAAANPGFVTSADLAQLGARLDKLIELTRTLEEHVKKLPAGDATLGNAAAKAGDKPPPPHP